MRRIYRRIYIVPLIAAALWGQDLRPNLKPIPRVQVKRATGKITIDKNRNPVKSAVVLKIENKAYKFQTTVNPI